MPVAAIIPKGIVPDYAKQQIAYQPALQPLNAPLVAPAPYNHGPCPQRKSSLLPYTCPQPLTSSTGTPSAGLTAAG